MWQSWIWWKTPLCKWPTLWMTPCLICHRNMFAGKFVKSERYSTVLREYIIFNIKRVDVRKWVRFFERSCIVEWVIIFASFSWLWGFLLEKMKIKKSPDDFHWNVWTNTKTLYVRNNIFKKRIPNLRFWIIYILVEISLLGTTLGRFSQLFFSFFVVG